MTNSKSLILFFFFQALLAFISLPISQSRTVFPNDDDLINEVCGKTYDTEGCIQTLKSDPRSAKADTRGLAVIMVDAMKPRGNDALNKINELLKRNPPPGIRDPLRYCVSMYTEILNQNIAETAQALNGGDFKTAEYKANEISIKSNRCQQTFAAGNPPLESPITDKNDAMYFFLLAKGKPNSGPTCLHVSNSSPTYKRAVALAAQVVTINSSILQQLNPLLISLSTYLFLSKMTASNSLALIFIIQALLLATFSVSLTHSRTTPPNDVAFIKATCKRTPNYDVCVQSLMSDPKSSQAGDVTGLALIMVNVMKSKANDALDKINHILRKGRDPTHKHALRECADNYKTVLEADIPMAIEALKKGNPKFAEDGANDAAIEAKSCEDDEFGGKSSLTPYNKIMHEVSVVTAAIVRNLL
ncbi:hypothetical protein L6164_011950 [Bauhinia variegata]|uniref:Uncharacterized protein n=1 Tax=Bauhinia variegata TaxID=167791 RepID=A0ACB9P7H6_BAUVA|nr:hypothetical protein L6164_011950 [Bauhinia variegata]